MITLTLIRHGESEDNLRTVWAGWKDAPLSEHGMNQAKALGASLSTFSVAAIFSSDLKRALWTGQQVQVQQKQPNKPQITTTELLREQHWGDAEGHGWMPPDPSILPGSIDPTTGESLWPVQEGRAGRLPNGESCDDVANRTGLFFDKYIAKYVQEAKGKPLGEVNVVVTSHGIAISELIGAIFKRALNGEGKDPESWRGLVNTGWTRLVIGVENESLDYNPEGLLASPVLDAPPVASKDEGCIISEVVEATNPPLVDQHIPSGAPIIARVVATNQAPHLAGLTLQTSSGTPDDETDARTKAVKEFFGGA